VAIEKFQDLDRNLTSIVEPVAELRGGKLAVRGLRREVDCDIDHLANRAAQEEVIMRDLVDLAETAEQLQRPPNLRFRRVEDCADIAHARRAKALAPRDQWPRPLP
jgi:hypothetical protein